jgi:hypothetical protein
MVADWCPAANGEACMHLDGCIVPRPGQRLAQRVVDRDGRGIDHGPVRHVAEGSRQINLLHLGVGQGQVGQRRHAPLEGHLEPPIASGTRDVGHLTLQIRAQNVRLIGTPGVSAETIMARMNIPRFSLRCHSITLHGLSLRSVPSCPVLLMPLRRASRVGGRFSVMRPSIGSPGILTEKAIFWTRYRERG